MAKPNYGYEKRQKELAKQRKKEDKLKARQDRKAGVEPADGEIEAPAEGDAAPPADQPVQP